MRDHWLSQFYLRGFLENNSEKLYVYNLKNKSGFFKSPKSICWSEDYYNLFNAGFGNERLIDDYFKYTVEDKAAPIIKKISSDFNCSLTIEDKKNLAVFISFLRIKIPKFEKIAKEFAERGIQEYLKKLTELKEAENFIKDYEEKTGLKSDMTAEDFLVFIKNRSKYYKASRDIYFLRRMFPIGKKQVDLMLDMDWSFIYASPKRAFITCDNPFIMLKEGKVYNDKIVSILDPKAIKIIPLSKNVCLFIGFKNKNLDTLNTYRKFKSYGGESIRLINTTSIDNSDELVIGSNEKIVQKLLKIKKII
ncbi:MAG: DUF4238 domain-containing protein [Actinomycetota bacterium]|nr:DUF4238 domain-containing protein [Actinomycetota bacterium]